MSTVEIATISHEGKNYTALGATVDVDRGHIVAYASPVPGAQIAFDLKTFSGSHIAVMRKTGESRGFYGSRITHFAMDYAGFRWHGKCGLDWNQLVHMRRGRAL